MKNLKLFTARLMLALLLIVVFSASALSVDDDFCWLNSYGRGVGTIPTEAGAGRVIIGALSYSQCPANTARFGFDCHSVCPSGMRDDGLFCRASEYGRGFGYPWQFGDAAFSLDGANSRCAEENSQGCEQYGLIIYPKCRAGYAAFGSNICRPAQPNCQALGMNNGIDLSCAKKITIGDPNLLLCRSGLQTDAGLCYPGCRPGFNGVGPVCWGQCPTGYVACGAGCASSNDVCAEVTSNQVLSTLDLIINVATFGASGGANVAEEAADLARRIDDAKRRWSTFQRTDDFKRIEDTAAGIEIAERMNQVANASSDEEAVRLLADFDPTGISQVVSAYGRRICNASSPR